MKFKPNTSVRAMLDNLPAHEDRDYTDEKLKQIQEMFSDDGQPKKKVSLKLKSEEKLAIYHQIKERVIKGATPDDISKAVIACLDEHLEEKEKEAFGKELSKGLIRRVE